MNTILKLNNIWKQYGRNEDPVVRGVDLELHEGEILALLGPSGCGKTTILRTIAGFEKPERGSIKLNGGPIIDTNHWTRPEKRDVGFVFQDYALFPHLNVYDNIAFGLNKLSRKERKKRVERAISLSGLTGLEKRSPHELSGGQQQRVALARSMAPGPKVILLDEPFSNLDASLRAETRTEVRQILKKTGMSAILVTHDQEEALTVADRIAVMNDGVIEQVGTPIDIYRNPSTAFVAQFLGVTNLFQADAVGTCAHSPFGCFDINEDTDGMVTLSVRPEQLVMEPTEDTDDAGVILSREFKGHDQLYRVKMGGEELIVMTDHRCDLEAGTHVTIHNTEPAIVVQTANRSPATTPDS